MASSTLSNQVTPTEQGASADAAGRPEEHDERTSPEPSNEPNSATLPHQPPEPDILDEDLPPPYTPSTPPPPYISPSTPTITLPILLTRHTPGVLLPSTSLPAKMLPGRPTQTSPIRLSLPPNPTYRQLIFRLRDTISRVENIWLPCRTHRLFSRLVVRWEGSLEFLARESWGRWWGGARRGRLEFLWTVVERGFRGPRSRLERFLDGVREDGPVLVEEVVRRGDVGGSREG